MNIAILILAAGAASRMGTVKQNLEFNGTTLLGNAIDQALATGMQNVYCVLGAHFETVGNSIQDKAATVIENKNWKNGLGSSIACGIKNIEVNNLDAVLVMLADQPLIDAEYLKQLIQTATEHPHSCVASDYGKKNGVPAVFPKQYFKELERLSGDQGAKELLNGPATSVVKLDARDRIRDIDTPEEYARLLKK